MKNLTQKNYNSFQDFEQVILPLNLGILISEDDSVRLLSQIVDNVSVRGFAVGRNTRRSVRTMLKLLIYGYMNNTYSSRRIETLCRRDINFMWLLNGEASPDHNTIARFRQNFSKEIADVFKQVTVMLAQNKEIDFENVFIDGTKIEANANRYSFVWKGTNDKLREKLFSKIEAFAKQISLHYAAVVKFDRQAATKTLEDVLFFLEQLMQFKGLTKVYGKGKHKTALQKDIDVCLELLEKQRKYNAYDAVFKDRRSFSKTDKDATFMRMKEDHMRNGQLKPGYNIQMAVNSGYIVGNMVCSDRNDVNSLVPFLKTLEKPFKNIVADSGYESEEAYAFLQENGYESYIKPQNYEARKTKAYKMQIGKRENMIYDSASDVYICHNGKKLLPTYNRQKRSPTGYLQNITTYACESCKDCPFKERCTKSKTDKQIDVSRVFNDLREKSYRNISSTKGRELMLNRSIQAEGVFAVIKENFGFRKFLLRGMKNVSTEVNLLALAYNISKFHIKIQNCRLKTHIYRIE
jgi:transposase